MQKIILLLSTFFIISNANIIISSPLSAILKDESIKEAIVTINKKNNTLSYKVTNQMIQKYNGIPIVFLYEDFENKIDIEYIQNNETKKDTYFLKTPKINKKIKINKNADNFSNRFYFVVDEDSNFIIDSLGNIRWFSYTNTINLNEIFDIFNKNEEIFIAQKDSIIKLNYDENTKWIMGGEKNTLQNINANGNKILCDDCKLSNVENIKKIDFLSIADIIYLILFDNNTTNAKAQIYKIDEKKYTNELLWQYKIKDRIQNGKAIYTSDFHSIFINYKDMDNNLHILELKWGNNTPTIDIKINNAKESIPFDVNYFLQ